MKTTGRSSAGMRPDRSYFCSRSRGSIRLRISIIFMIAPVAPEPQKITTSPSSPAQASRITRRASSRKQVVCRPVREVSVWVLA